MHWKCYVIKYIIYIDSKVITRIDRQFLKNFENYQKVVIHNNKMPEKKSILSYVKDAVAEKKSLIYLWMQSQTIMFLWVSTVQSKTLNIFKWYYVGGFHYERARKTSP